MVYSIIPIGFVAMNPWLNETSTILRAYLIAFSASLYLIIRRLDFRLYKFEILSLGLILAWYLLGRISTEQNLPEFLQGAYGRSFGFFTLMSLYLWIIISAENFSHHRDKFLKYSYVTLVIAISYGLLQATGLDFFSWALNFQGIRLTLANPNFSSAFLAMQSVIPLIFFFQTRGKLRFLHLTVYLATLVMIYLTKSYQGAVMVLISIIVGILAVLFMNRNLKYFWSVLIGFSFSILLVISAILLKISPLYEKFLQIEPSMGILARLSHWQIGINIWLDNPIFGVGIENLGRYSGAYISKDFSNSLGGMVTPDKSHNTLIDHFANGGFVAGAAWFAFAIYISLLAVKIHAQKSAGDSHWIKIGLSSIWFMHLFQSFISTDHIYNVLIAYLSAGAIISIYNKSKNNL